MTEKSSWSSGKSSNLALGLRKLGPQPPNRLGGSPWCQKTGQWARLPGLLSEVQVTPHRLWISAQLSSPVVSLAPSVLTLQKCHKTSFSLSISTPPHCHLGRSSQKTFQKVTPTCTTMEQWLWPQNKTCLLNKAFSNQTEMQPSTPFIPPWQSSAYTKDTLDPFCHFYWTLERLKRTLLSGGLEYFNNWITLRELVACTTHNCLFNLVLGNY